MNILIIGNGGREHALAWKLKQSSQCDQLFIAPGNTGTAQCGTNVPIHPTDFSSLASFCLKNNVSLVFVGPEEPLVRGICNYFREFPPTAHINIIGPSSEAAQLEGSKAFAKAFMQRHGIPTAAYREFTADNYTDGIEYIRTHNLPIVLKADGLAAGKGVLICNNHLEALAEFELMIQRSKFGEAGKKVVVEEFLKGIELSVFVLTDGKEYLMLPEAKDYKRVGRGDTGPNTGGMGAVSPVPFANGEFMQKVITKVVQPTINGLNKEKMDYKGIVFIGLIKVDDEPFVIEYNCRLGDPETEVVLPRIESDLVEILMALGTGKLAETKIDITPQTAVTVVAVSAGYPNEYQTGKLIEGLTDTAIDGTIIFHAGTKSEGEDIVTNGGRVLAVTSFGDNATEASEQSVYALENLFFEGMYYRDDIGYEFKGAQE
ncbi:MAG TPA: phosphoribosylamine--glycine ligase [Ferruginibacter sp.]|nr:phosphoribosylamine--glycine ligase [Ferruginibacter sp.]HMP19537.1 phosphoribosylamine--glycine ligase [Ferruginibacter sp.]